MESIPARPDQANPVARQKSYTPLTLSTDDFIEELDRDYIMKPPEPNPEDPNPDPTIYVDLATFDKARADRMQKEAALIEQDVRENAAFFEEIVRQNAEDAGLDPTEDEIQEKLEAYIQKQIQKDVENLEPVEDVTRKRFAKASVDDIIELLTELHVSEVPPEDYDQILVKLAETTARDLDWVKAEFHRIQKDVDREKVRAPFEAKRREYQERQQEKAKAAGEKVKGQEVPRTSTVCYIKALDAFYHIKDGLMVSRAQQDAMNPTPRGEPRWCDKFFAEAKEVGFNFFNRITYAPGGPRVDVQDGCTLLNTWRRPEGLKPVTGDVSIWSDLMARLFPNEEERTHILDWMAFTAQQQGTKINHCLLIIGINQGQGKDSAFEPLLHVIGPGNHTMVAGDQLSSPFNSYLKDTKLVMVQEIMDFGQREVENRLKPLLAAPPNEIAINEKNVKQYELPNICNFAMFSNHLKAARVSKGARRYFVVKTEAPPMTPAEAKALWQWYQTGNGLNKVADYLLTRDISAFDPKADPPMTEAKEELVELSKPAYQTEVEEVLEGAMAKRKVFTIRELLSHHAIDFPRSRTPTTNQLSTLLREIGYSLRVIKVEGKAQRLWFPREYEQNLADENGIPIADLYRITWQPDFPDDMENPQSH